MLNHKIEGLAPSRSMVVMEKAKRMKQQDPQIIDLAGGEPDFDTPPRISMEMFRWVSQGYTHYTVGPGLPELRARIVQKLHEDNSCNYSPENIIVTPGAKYAIYAAVCSLVNPGDEVLYLTPAWVSYAAIIEASNAVPVPVALDGQQNYRITLEALEEKATDKTRLMIINYPNNPTGRILHRDELDVLTQFLLQHPQIVLLSDEIYERITYDRKRSLSPASVQEIADRVVTVNGFSKCAAMTGWRIGYLAAAPEIVAGIHKLFQHTITCVSGFIQKAAVVALDCTEEMEAMRQRFEARRNLFISGLNSIQGVQCVIPEGAFYAWTVFDIPGIDSKKVCEFLLEKAKVVGVPGISYGEEKAASMRFSFAASERDLEQAVINIRKAMESLSD